MASFVVHHTAAMHFLKKLEESGIKISQKNKNDFLLGNLIVDSIDKELMLINKFRKKLLILWKMIMKIKLFNILI